MIIIPHQLIPSDKQICPELLHSYFPNQIVSSTLTNEGWLITLNWPTTADYYVDPYLIEGLHWWSQKVGVKDIPFAVKQEPKWQLSLNDSWTLFSWSSWLSSYVTENELPNEIVLLHIDDHDDLMSPHLWLKQDGWIDIITQQLVNLLIPESVAAAIQSGAIGIGSFIVPLLYQIPQVHIRHLCATEYSISRRGTYLLKCITASDGLLNPNMLRPTVNLKNISKIKDNIDDNLSTYSVSSKLEEWLKNLPNVPILLHIDLDYFNNRFNGDSDWALQTFHHDPSIDQILAAIDSVFNALYFQGIFEQIVNITVALSPGFFPAEFWAKATERISYYIDKLWIDSTA